MPADLRFDAMGTWAHVMVVGGRAGAGAQARARIEQLEARWSRFRPDSEVSRLNAAGGRPVTVSADTVTLLERAFAGRRATGGRFDPLLLGPLTGLGYDRTFELVAGGTASSSVAVASTSGFDPGGIGKGLAADLVVEELLAAGADGACVNLGGDLRAEGAGPWVVDVADPFHAERPPMLSLAIDAGGVATSSRLRRVWSHGGGRRHHLIDPTTGRPADTGVAAATVLTGEAWRAEVLAKAAVLAGVGGALDLLEEFGAAGVVVDDARAVHRTPGLDRFLA